MCWLGCAGARLGSGQQRWHEVETQHFKLYTDLPRAEAQGQAAELERLLHAFEHSAFQIKGELPLKLNVVMFASDMAFHDYSRDEIGGYVVRDLLYEPWMVVPAPNRTAGLQVLNHELTHHITMLAMQNQPAWLLEGLATYFESAQFEEGGTRFVVGRVPLRYFHVLRERRLVPPSVLMQPEGFRTDAPSYASAWALVHYLMSKRGAQFASYQQLLAKGVGFTRAFAEAFLDLTPTQLDAEVASYLSDGLYESVSFVVPPQQAAPVRERVLARADEHALSGLLWSGCPRCSERHQGRAKESFQLALADDPMQVQAKAISVQDGAGDALAEARRLTEAHPQHWLSWLTLALAAHAIEPASELSTQLADQAAERAVTLAPSQAYAWMARAFRFAAHGDRDQALRAADKAYHLQRNAPNLLISRAALLAGLADCGPLHELVTRMGQQPELGLSMESQLKLQQLASACSVITPSAAR